MSVYLNLSPNRHTCGVKLSGEHPHVVSVLLGGDPNRHPRRAIQILYIRGTLIALCCFIDTKLYDLAITAPIPVDVVLVIAFLSRAYNAVSAAPCGVDETIRCAGQGSALGKPKRRAREPSKILAVALFTIAQYAVSAATGGVVLTPRPTCERSALDKTK